MSDSKMRIVVLLAAMVTASSCLPAPAAALNHASDLYKSGRYEDAAREYQRAIDLNPSWAPPYLGLGNALWQLNRRSEALPAYRRAAELKPQWIDAQISLGSALLDLNRADEAIPILAHALEIDPNNPSAKALLDQARARAVRRTP